MDAMIPESIQSVMAALERNNMKSYFAKDRESAKTLVMSMIGEDDTVAAGGSATLDECGIRQALQALPHSLSLEGLDEQKKAEVRRRSLTCDVYVSGSNAITQDGKIVNIDGRGNRVAAMIFGPKKVIIVAGKNKLTKSLDEAMHRIRNIAAPKNCVKLKRDTPCAKTGKCTDCSGSDRICSTTVILERQWQQRIHVVIVDEVLGF